MDTPGFRIQGLGFGIDFDAKAVKGVEEDFSELHCLFSDFSDQPGVSK